MHKIGHATIHILGPIYFIKSSFVENIFQIFSCLFIIKKID